EISEIDNATSDAIDHDWNPGTAELLIVSVRDDIAETLSLCRSLRSQMGRAHTPLFVLIASAEEPLVEAALEAGASCCLRLPVDPKERVGALRRLHDGQRTGRHTRDIHHAQEDDPWRDDGGES